MKSFYKNKNVLITGHTGFKGAWLSQILLNLGANVCGYSLEPAEEINLYSIFNLNKNAKSIISDIRDLDKLKVSLSDFKPEIVFHLAAQPIVRESYINPVYTYETNVMGTVNILEAIRECESVKSAVNVTTDKVYENKEISKGYIEEDNLCGYDPYSNSKSCSELVTYSYKKSFFYMEDAPAISTARAGNVIGAGDFSKNRIIPDCVRAGYNNDRIEVRSPNSIRPYQYVLDCLYGYLLLAKLQYDKKDISGSYNFGPDINDCVTTKDLVEKFCASWGNNLNYYIKTDNIVHESNILMLDSTKAHTNLNWNPKYCIDESVKRTVELYKIIKERNFENYANTHIINFFSEL